MLENQEKKFSEYFNSGDNLRLSVQERLRKAYAQALLDFPQLFEMPKEWKHDSKGVIVMETTLDKVNSLELYGSKVISYTPRTTEQYLKKGDKILAWRKNQNKNSFARIDFFKERSREFYMTENTESDYHLYFYNAIPFDKDLAGLTIGELEEALKNVETSAKAQLFEMPTDWEPSENEFVLIPRNTSEYGEVVKVSHIDERGMYIVITQSGQEQGFTKNRIKPCNEETYGKKWNDI